MRRARFQRTLIAPRANYMSMSRATADPLTWRHDKSSMRFIGHPRRLACTSTRRVSS